MIEDKPNWTQLVLDAEKEPLTDIEVINAIIFEWEHCQLPIEEMQLAVARRRNASPEAILAIKYLVIRRKRRLKHLTGLRNRLVLASEYQPVEQHQDNG